MNIKGKFVTLRAMTREDMPLIVDMFNDPEIESLVIGWAFPISLEQQNKWFDDHISDKDSFRFVIETREDGAVGIATLTDIDWKNRRASHGIKIMKSQNRGKGIGTDAVMAIMRYAFDELNLHRLDSGVFPENAASRALYSHKCGWSEEGLRKEYIYKGGKYRDFIPTGITNNQYYELIAKNHYWG